MMCVLSCNNGSTWDGFSGHLLILDIINCCFVVAIKDLLHDVEAIHSLC